MEKEQNELTEKTFSTMSDTSLQCIKVEEELTPELLRKFPGFQDYTDDQAEDMVRTIKQFAEILYDLEMSKDSYNVDNQSDNGLKIDLSESAENQQAA
jgi:hypothetical protein